LVDVITLTRPDGEARPGGLASACSCNAVLAQSPFDATPADRLALTRLEARILGVTDDQVDAAAALVERLFAHDLLKRARAADARARAGARRRSPARCPMV